MGINPKVRDQDLLEPIKKLEMEHPFWGYPQVNAWLVHREKMRFNEKRVRRVMKKNRLIATQTVYKAKSSPQRTKPRAERPRQYWGIDCRSSWVLSWDGSIW